MLNMLHRSLSLKLRNVLRFLRVGSKQESANSSFERASKKINPKTIKQLSQTLIAEFYTDNELVFKAWKGFRLLAINASRIRLPHIKELRPYFGETKKPIKTGIIRARCSVLYDLENNYILDGELAPIGKSDRTMALSRLTHCKQGDLIMCARTYPSYDFIKYHIINNLDYVIRVKFGFNKQILNFKKSKKKSQIVIITSHRYKKLSIKTSNKTVPIKVRLIRLELPTGQVEILMTSLLDSKNYPNSIFKSLYNKRWSVESIYDELMNKLKVEHFSGYSKQSILQDFHTALFISNIQTRIINELEDALAKKSGKIGWNYKIKTNLSYVFLKNRVIQLFFAENSIEEPLMELRQLFKEKIIPQ